MQCSTARSVSGSIMLSSSLARGSIYIYSNIGNSPSIAWITFCKFETGMQRRMWRTLVMVLESEQDSPFIFCCDLAIFFNIINGER